MPLDAHRTALAILETFWSPLPRHEPEALKRYVAHVLHLAKKGAPDALRQHLSALRTHELGAPVNAEVDRQVAEALVSIFGE